ncbi:hypothetical protein QL285_091086 [Trifolium repens]|nr:hypothetical protein QL285_091086 [Trifolium repens]
MLSELIRSTGSHRFFSTASANCLSLHLLRFRLHTFLQFFCSGFLLHPSFLIPIQTVYQSFLNNSDFGLVLHVCALPLHLVLVLGFMYFFQI